MSDETPETETPLLDLLEAVHDFGGLIIALAEHDAAALLNERLAAGPVDEDTLERLHELLDDQEFQAIVARHAKP